MPKLSIESRVVSIYPNKEATKKSSAGMEHKTAMEYKLELDKLEKLRLQSHKAGKPFVKRSSLLPWNTTKQHTAPGVPSQAKFVSSQTVKPSPQPARVASDVTAAAAVPVQSQDGSVTRKANLSTSEKIAALQEDWERRHLGGSENRSLSECFVFVLLEILLVSSQMIHASLAFILLFISHSSHCSNLHLTSFLSRYSSSLLTFHLSLFKTLSNAQLSRFSSLS